MSTSSYRRWTSFEEESEAKAEAVGQTSGSLARNSGRRLPRSLPNGYKFQSTSSPASSSQTFPENHIRLKCPSVSELGLAPQALERACRMLVPLSSMWHAFRHTASAWTWNQVDIAGSWGAFAITLDNPMECNIALKLLRIISLGAAARLIGRRHVLGLRHCTV